jgi:hypothetical protein
MSEFCNFEGSIPEVSKTFNHLFSILKITFFVITFFFESITVGFKKKRELSEKVLSDFIKFL